MRFSRQQLLGSLMLLLLFVMIAWWKYLRFLLA